MSPIIATILLVAITVVLAAVLYVLVSGLTKSGASSPYSIGFVSTGAVGSSPNYFDQMSISPSSGLTTSMFGMQVTGPSGTIVANAAAVGGTGCTLAATPTTFAEGAAGCNGPTAGWYGVLVNSGNGIVALYLGSTWSYATGTTTIALSSSYSLYVVSATLLSGQDNTLSAYSTGTSSVSGSGSL